VGGERFQQLERGLAAPRVGQRSDTHDYALDIAQLRDETLDQQPREPPGGGALESLGLLGEYQADDLQCVVEGNGGQFRGCWSHGRQIAAPQRTACTWP
jgi:hypothetical protein